MMTYLMKTWLTRGSWVLTLVIVIQAGMLSGCMSLGPDIPEEHGPTTAYDFEFASGIVHVPNRFFPISLEAFMQSILDSDLSQEQKNARIGQLVTLEQYGPNLALFVTEENIFDNMMLVGGPGMEFKPNNARFYLNGMEDAAESAWNRVGADFEKLERRYINESDIDILKLSYKFTMGGRDNYMCQYVITRGSKTMGITVTNDHGEDYESIVRAIGVPPSE